MADIPVRFRTAHSDEPWHDYDPKTREGRCGAAMPLSSSWAVVETDPQPRCKNCEEKA